MKKFFIISIITLYYLFIPSVLISNAFAEVPPCPDEYQDGLKP